MGYGVVRSEPQGLIVMDNGLLEPALAGQGEPQVILGFGIVGPEPQRLIVMDNAREEFKSQVSDVDPYFTQFGSDKLVITNNLATTLYVRESKNPEIGFNLNPEQTIYIVKDSLTDTLDIRISDVDDFDF